MKVTICIPCHNAASWVRQAVQSALDQRDVEPEVIVVDDGSTDGSADIVREFGDRVKLIAGPRKGATTARNLAWQSGSGEWVQFLDADDFLEPGKIATQLAETEGGREADVIYSPVWIETWTNTGSTRERSETSPGEDIFTQWITWRIPQTGGALWRRTTLDALGGWNAEQPCCQEHELYLRAILARQRFRYTPTPGAVYRIWSEETLCRKDPRMVARVRTGLIDTMLDWLTRDGRLTTAHRTAAGQVFFEQARTMARFDLAEAAAFCAERKARGIFHVGGPAAPTSYRIIHSLLGFSAAEKIARLLR
jgi:hypothetical protein